MRPHRREQRPVSVIAGKPDFHSIKLMVSYPSGKQPEGPVGHEANVPNGFFGVGSDGRWAIPRVLTAFCCAWSRAVHAEAIIAAEGQTMTNPSGRVVPHPAVYIAAAAWRDVAKFEAQLGLTPSSEVNLSTPPDDDDSDDPFGA